MRKQSCLDVTLADIQNAERALQTYVKPSPLLFNAWLSEALGCEIYLKLENMQPIGSFKLRGATYKILKLSKTERKRGVIAASAGNHAQGVAWASLQLGVSSLIVMPKGAPLVKVQNTQMLGAEVVSEGENYDEAYRAALRIARKTGRVYVHGFEDPEVIAGQGTVGLEILKTLPDVDMVIGSVGGGGLMGGVAIAIKALKPETQIIGCQAVGAPSMLKSFQKGRAVCLEQVETFADGIAISAASEGIRKILKPRLSQLLLADDERIAAAILMLMEKAKVVAEGAGALPLACVQSMKKKEIRGKKVVLIISGGNIDVNVLSRIIDRGLIRAGRRLRVNVLISDRTGSLARLTDLMGRMGANIIQAIHDREEPATRIDQTGVALTLEVRGPHHGDQVIQALKEHVLRLELVG